MAVVLQERSVIKYSSLQEWNRQHRKYLFISPVQIEVAPLFALSTVSCGRVFMTGHHMGQKCVSMLKAVIAEATRIFSKYFSVGKS